MPKLTNTELEKITNMAIGGKSPKTISQETGISYMRVYHFVKKNKIFNSDKLWSMEEVDLVKRLAAEGKTHKEIGERMGVQKHCIDQLAIDYKIPSLNSQPKTKNQKRECVKMYLAGKTIEEIEKLTGIGHSTVGNMLKEAQVVTKMGAIKRLNYELESQGKRRCSYCKEILPLDEFRKDGHGKWARLCKKCANESARVLFARNKSNPTLEFFAKEKVSRIKSRIKRRGITCSITHQDFMDIYNEQNGKCFYTGKTMDINLSSIYSASPDRVNPNKNYEKGNVVLCCMGVNFMKGTLQLSEFENFCGNVVKHRGIDIANATAENMILTKDGSLAVR